ncbi:MAG TPA: branched-chain amino acid ABC transporter permease [Mycobacteriales bacterium]|nr:branched-chain amino acid ABC transporter permease [Mycobacteriales bacterium]
MLLRHGIPAVAGLGLLLAVTGGLSQYRNNQLAQIATEVCAVAGLTVLTGLSGQISLGNGAFMFVGAYTVALLLKHHPSANNGEFVLILLAAIVVAALAGALVGVAAARLRGPYLAGITLALAIGLPTLPKYSRLQGPLGGHAGFSVDAPLGPNGIDYIRWQAWVCCIAAVITLFLLANLSASRVGRAFRAVRDDEIAASLAGMSVARIQILAFVVSAACAGLAGGLLADVAGNIEPDSFPLTLSLGLLAAAVFGGLGTLSGAVYGSIVVILLPTWSQDLANHVSLSDKVVSNLPYALYGLGLIVGMLLFPLGIQGGLRRLAGRARNTLRTKPAGNYAGEPDQD